MPDTSPSLTSTPDGATSFNSVNTWDERQDWPMTDTSPSSTGTPNFSYIDLTSCVDPALLSTDNSLSDNDSEITPVLRLEFSADWLTKSADPEIILAGHGGPQSDSISEILFESENKEHSLARYQQSKETSPIQRDVDNKYEVEQVLQSRINRRIGKL